MLQDFSEKNEEGLDGLVDESPAAPKAKTPPPDDGNTVDPEVALLAIQQVDKWSCPACTFINSNFEKTCQMCTAKRPEMSFEEQRKAAIEFQKMMALRNKPKKKFDIADLDRQRAERQKQLEREREERGEAQEDAEVDIGDNDEDWEDDDDWDDQDEVDSPPAGPAPPKAKKPDIEEKKDDDELYDTTDFDKNSMDVLRATQKLLKNQEREAIAAVKKLSSNNVLTKSSVRKRMQEKVQSFADTTNMSPPKAEVVLISLKWRENKAIELFMASQESDKKTREFQKKHGVVSSLPTKPETKGKVFCIFCCEEHPVKNTYHLGCGHQHCMPCWGSYIEAELDKGISCIKVKCPGNPKCGVRIAPTIVRAILGKRKKALGYYEDHLLENYLQSHTALGRCPAPSCAFIIESLEDHLDTECECGHVSCFKCKDPGHGPASCELMEKWNELHTSEGENVTWIKANTKRCPKCRVNIEKNKGCMHMTCRNCRHEFCWLCKGDWQGHSRCNKAPDVVRAENEANKAQKSLERFEWYFTRWQAHGDAYKSSHKKSLECATKMYHLLSLFPGKSWSDVEYVVLSTNEITRCRRMLQHTYAVAYYLPDASKEKKLFQHHQGELEWFTDTLHELIEMNEGTDHLVSNTVLRTRIITLTNTVKKFRENLVEAIQTISESKTVDPKSGKKMAPEADSEDEDLTAPKKGGFWRSMFARS